MRTAVEVGIWTVLLAGLACTWVTSVSVGEATFAVVAAFPCAVLAAGGRKAEFGTYRPRGLPLGHLLRLPIDIVTDLGRLGRYLWRTVRGTATGSAYSWFRLSPCRGSARQAARRASLTLAISTAPGCYVAQVHPDESGRDLLLVHRIDSTASGVPEPVGHAVAEPDRGHAAEPGCGHGAGPADRERGDR